MSLAASSPSPSELVDLIRNCPLLQSIDRECLAYLEQELQWVPLEPGEVLFHEGDPVDAFYIVVDGLLEVTTVRGRQKGSPSNERIVLAQVGADSPIGEMQILSGGRRSATVTAIQPSHLVRCSKDGFDRFLSSDAQVVRELAKTILPRLFRDQMVRVLPRLFGELQGDALRDLESRMTWVHLSRGQTLFQQGDPSDSFFIIISGRMQVIINDEHGRPQVVGEMPQGESVGEMGVFTSEPRSATVVASRDTELVRFSKRDFDQFSQQYPRFMERVTRLLSQRLKRAHRRATSDSLSINIMLIPACPRVRLREFAERFCAALATMGPCLLLTSKRVDDLLGRPGTSQAEEGAPDDLRLRSWLNQQEQEFRFIVYQSDPGVTHWTKRCIRQADQVLCVADANAPGDLTAIECEVQQQEAACRTRRQHGLVLLHRDGSQPPQNTFRWLSRRDVQRHWHVRLDRDWDFDRVARFVAGRAVGLVLSGGGARGFAHVGVIRAMQEIGIPIDVVAGVSMGALISAGYAFSEDFDAMVDRIKAQLKGVMGDYTIPIISLSCGRRFDRRVKELFGATRIEDLWIPYFCVSSNLTQANIMIHRRGPLWRAVRASGSLPGIVPPVIQDGDLLYDGCLLDNLPMDVMRRELGDGLVIAVDVVPPVDLAVEVTPVDSPTGFQILWSRLNPFAKRIKLPSILSILQRAGELGSVYGRQKLIDEQVADLYLRPPVEEFEILDFSTVDETARRGYVYARAQLSKWWSEQG